MLETRRFAGTLSIGVLATPAVNILPLTNPPGGPWVVLLTEKGRQIVQSERIEREGGRRGRTRENARWRARDARARKGGGTTRIARLVETERKEDGAFTRERMVDACARGVVAVADVGEVVVVVVVILFVTVPLVVCATR